MNAQTQQRGGELISGGRAIGPGPQWLAQAWSGGINRVLDRIDRGLDRGAILAQLPDGSTRMLGGRADGFVAEVRLHTRCALLRLATTGSVGWYQAWEAGEWTQPRSGAAVRAVHGQRRVAGQRGAGAGAVAAGRAAAHWLNRNTRAGARATSLRTTISAMISTRAGSARR